MARPTDQQVAYLSSQLAARLLENATLPEHEDALLRAMRDWLPDTDRVDAHMLKELARSVRANLEICRALLLNRLDRLVTEGKAETP